MKSKKFTLIIICFIVFSTFIGCFDLHEATDWAYIYSIGAEVGVKDRLRLTVQMPSMRGGMGNEESSSSGITTIDKSGIITITIDCPTFYSGIDMVATFLSRELNYIHTKFIVFSERLAKMGIDNYLTGFIRGRQVRREMYILVTKGSARDFLIENIPPLETSLSRKQENHMKQAKRTGLFCSVTYGELLNSVKSPYNQGIAALAAVNKLKEYAESQGTELAATKSNGAYSPGEIARNGGSRAELLGTAIFDGAKMVGELNGDETRAMLMARNEFYRGSFVIQDPKSPRDLITVSVKKQKGSKVKVNTKGKKPQIKLKVFLEGDILAIQSTVNYESRTLNPVLEEAFTKLIKKQLDKTIEKCKLLNCDVFKFGRVAAMNFSTISEFEEYNWLKKFGDAVVNTEVEFKIRRTGTMLKASEIQQSGEEKGGTAE